MTHVDSLIEHLLVNCEIVLTRMLYTLRMWNGEEEEENKYMWNTWKLWYMKY